jgi:hypothetical protein
MRRRGSAPSLLPQDAVEGGHLGPQPLRRERGVGERTCASVNARVKRGGAGGGGGGGGGGMMRVSHGGWMDVCVAVCATGGWMGRGGAGRGGAGGGAGSCGRAWMISPLMERSAALGPVSRRVQLGCRSVASTRMSSMSPPMFFRNGRISSSTSITVSSHSASPVAETCSTARISGMVSRSPRSSPIFIVICRVGGMGSVAGKACSTLTHKPQAPAPAPRPATTNRTLRSPTTMGTNRTRPGAQESPRRRRCHAAPHSRRRR